MASLLDDPLAMPRTGLMGLPMPDIANAGRPDDAWTSEHEAMLPSIFQRDDKDEQGDAGT